MTRFSILAPGLMVFLMLLPEPTRAATMPGDASKHSEPASEVRSGRPSHAPRAWRGRQCRMENTITRGRQGRRIVTPRRICR